VFSYPDLRGEVGYFPILPTPAADRLCAARFPRGRSGRLATIPER
jgi:hypothetical protein